MKKQDQQDRDMPIEQVWFLLGEVADFVSGDVDRRADAIELEMNAVALLTGVNVLNRRSHLATQPMPSKLRGDIERCATRVRRAVSKSGSYADIQHSITELLTCAINAKAEYDHEQWLLSVARLGRTNASKCTRVSTGQA